MNKSRRRQYAGPAFDFCACSKMLSVFTKCGILFVLIFQMNKFV